VEEKRNRFISRRWFDEVAVAACKLLHTKGVMLVVEDETTISQKPCISKSMSFEAEHQKAEVKDITVVERYFLCKYPSYGLMQKLMVQLFLVALS
jgi:hypothetical protein